MRVCVERRRGGRGAAMRNFVDREAEWGGRVRSRPAHAGGVRHRGAVLGPAVAAGRRDQGLLRVRPVAAADLVPGRGVAAGSVLSHPGDGRRRHRLAAHTVAAARPARRTAGAGTAAGRQAPRQHAGTRDGRPVRHRGERRNRDRVAAVRRAVRRHAAARRGLPDRTRAGGHPRVVRLVAGDDRCELVQPGRAAESGAGAVPAADAGSGGGHRLRPVRVAGLHRPGAPAGWPGRGAAAGRVGPTTPAVHAADRVAAPLGRADVRGRGGGRARQRLLHGAQPGEERGARPDLAGGARPGDQRRNPVADQRGSHRDRGSPPDRARRRGDAGQRGPAVAVGGHDRAAGTARHGTAGTRQRRGALGPDRLRGGQARAAGPDHQRVEGGCAAHPGRRASRTRAQRLGQRAGGRRRIRRAAGSPGQPAVEPARPGEPPAALRGHAGARRRDDRRYARVRPLAVLTLGDEMRMTKFRLSARRPPWPHWSQRAVRHPGKVPSCGFS